MATRAGLETWLTARWPNAEDVRVLEDIQTFEANGLSSETLGIDVRWRVAGLSHEGRFVVRLPPAEGLGVFREYDLVKQGLVQSTLARTRVPVAEPVGVEVDRSWIGSPFLMMPYIQGRIPTMEYLGSGWVMALSSDERRQLMCNYIDTLADIHRLDWKGVGLEAAARTGGPGLASELAWWGDYHRWAAKDLPGEVTEPVAEVWEWVWKHRPTDEPPSSLIWGDPRINNVIFGDELEVAAVIDWETVTIAPAEVDLGWHFALRSTMTGLMGSDPELPGFLTIDEELDRYQTRLGRAVRDLDWHLVFGATRMAICILAIGRAAGVAGVSTELSMAPFPAWVEPKMRELD